MMVVSDESDLWDMTDYAACPYSRREITEAGKALKGVIPASAAHREEAERIFRIAHSWRTANIYPMRRVRAELVGKVRSTGGGITSARLKRMESIRKKLRTQPRALYQIQDISGCRAIVDDDASLAQLLSVYLDGGSRYQIVRHVDYIAEPRGTGYRGHHLIMKFSDPDTPGFNRHFTEVQLRTRAHHAWATAVEAVGLVRGEDLKGGDGSPDWLRLFELMAGEMADDTGLPLPASVSGDRMERKRELADINRRIDALHTLDSCNRAIRHTENITTALSTCYLIRYDTGAMRVDVQPFNSASVGTQRYDVVENDRNVTSVLVEVDRVADLRAAYPNYFLDVADFARTLATSLGKRRQGAVKTSEWLTGLFMRMRK